MLSASWPDVECACLAGTMSALARQPCAELLPIFQAGSMNNIHNTFPSLNLEVVLVES